MFADSSMSCVSLPLLCQSGLFANVTLKYWHLHANILVISNLLLFIVVVIELVTLEKLYRAVTLIVFAQQFLIFVCIVAGVTH